MRICVQERGAIPVPTAHLAERGTFPPAASAESAAEREVCGHPGTSALPEQPNQQPNQLDRARAGGICSWRLGVAAVEVEGAVRTRPDALSPGSRVNHLPAGTAASSPPLGFGSRSAGATGTAVLAVPSWAGSPIPQRGSRGSR